MKQFLSFLLLILAVSAAYSAEVLAPALQFDFKQYKNYFQKTTDYKVNLKTLSDYKITCDADIIGVVQGDLENLQVFDIKNEYNELLDMKSLVLKTKYETFSYIRIYKSTREVVNIMINTNPLFEDEVQTIGLCKIEPFRN